MKIKKIEIRILKIPFKVEFNHFLKSRDSTENIILKITSENYFGLGEAIPREYVTGETLEKIINTLETKLLPNLQKKGFGKMRDIIDYLVIYSKNIKKDELSAYACFSDALLNLGAQEFNFTLDDVMNYLNINSKQKTEKTEIIYSAVIGESNLILTIFKAIMIKIRKFDNVKIKISPNNLNQLKLIRKLLTKQTIYVDANCSFNNMADLEKLLEVLNKNNITYLEQPFAIENLNRFKIYETLKENNIKVILDESFCQEKDIDKIFQEGDIVNLRINKNGGILSTLILYKKLSEKNIKVMLGCMVGETILTRENLILAKKLNTLFNEGDYDLYLFSNPIIENPTFGKNGHINVGTLNLDLNQQIDLNTNISSYSIEDYEKP